MASGLELIFCGGNNARYADIAISAGFRYGARLPGTPYAAPLYFADQNWRKPVRAAYMAALARHRPVMASVIDWEREEQRGEVLSWAEEAAQHVQRVMVIPKVQGGIDRLPRQIGGAMVVLGFSIPTSHGGTELPLWDFAGWPVHLLGGSPQAQMRYYRHMGAIADVVSADGNMAMKMANARGQFWTNGNAKYAKDYYWPRLKEAGWNGEDAPYEAFRRSCINIRQAWCAIATILS